MLLQLQFIPDLIGVFLKLLIMEKLRQTLAVIFYLIWIPLGLLLIAGIIFLIVANPLAGLMSGGPSAGSEFEQFGTPGGGFQPTEEMMRQFIPNLNEEQGSR